MQFCPQCKSIIMPKRDGDKLIIRCKCGYSSDNATHTKMTEAIDKNTKIDVVHDTDAVETLPMTDETCPKCKHGKAHYWLVQTRAADEAPTKFLKCEKCKHTWRDYS